MVTPIFDPTHSKISEITLAFLYLHQHAQNQFTPSIHSWDTVNFRALLPDWPHPFLNIPTQKRIYQLLIYVNLFQQAKNQAIPLICFGDMVD